MLKYFPEFLERSKFGYKGEMKRRQLPLGKRYTADPDAAEVIDSAQTNSDNVSPGFPLGTAVQFCDDSPVTIPVGVHTAVGGDSDQPTPGDILCGAIAACLDSTIRIVANRVGVRLKELTVRVKGTVDVRGTLWLDKNIPVAFTRFDVHVHIKPRGFVPQKMLDKLLRASERSCIVIQTLRNGPEIAVTRD